MTLQHYHLHIGDDNLSPSRGCKSTCDSYLRPRYKIIVSVNIFNSIAIVINIALNLATWSSGVSLKRELKMQLRYVDTQSVKSYNGLESIFRNYPMMYFPL